MTDDFDYGDYDTNGVFVPVDESKAGAYPSVAQQDDVPAQGALSMPADSPRNGEQAIAFALDESKKRTNVGIGQCLKTVRGYYGVAAKYGTAALSWQHAAHKRRVASGVDVPRGVPVYWTGGSEGAGHVAISLGGGLCLSTDWLEPGRIDVAEIDNITTKWGLNFQGYAWEVNDVEVWKPAPPKPAVSLNNLYPKKNNPDVLDIKKALKAKGYGGFVTSGKFANYFGPGLKKAYAKYQTRLGYSGKAANGIPGRISLQKLGFKVNP